MSSDEKDMRTLNDEHAEENRASLLKEVKHCLSSASVSIGDSIYLMHKLDRLGWPGSEAWPRREELLALLKKLKELGDDIKL